VTSASPTVTARATAFSPTRPILFRIIFCLVIIWVAGLATLTVRTANPWIVNEVQIERSDAVFVGRWIDRLQGRFEAADDLLHRLPPGAVTITGLPTRGLPKTDEWVIPVRKSGEGFVVTQGGFSYVPRDPAGHVAPQPVEGEIAPQCLPAIPEVLQQIEQLPRR